MSDLLFYFFIRLEGRRKVSGEPEALGVGPAVQVLSELGAALAVRGRV